MSTTTTTSSQTTATAAICNGKKDPDHPCSRHNVAQCSVATAVSENVAAWMQVDCPARCGTCTADLENVPKADVAALMRLYEAAAKTLNCKVASFDSVPAYARTSATADEDNLCPGQ